MALAEEFGLMVVEDGCQAHLARYRKSDGRWQRVGTTGEFGAFSFYPGKNLGAYGEAGALVTNDEGLYEKAKMIRQHGEIERYNHKVIGHNYRIEAIQGAVLATKLKYLDEWTKKRHKNSRLYNELLGGVDGIQTPEELEGTDCVYHLYIIQADDRDGLQKYLQEKGVASGLHYPIPLHLQEAYEYLGYKEGDFPVAEKAAGRILSLPMYPELTEGQIRFVCDKIKEYMISPQRTQRTQRKEHYYLKETDNIREGHGGRRGQMSEVRCQMSEIRCQKSEGRNQRSEVGGQRAEIRGRMSEVGGQRAEGRNQRSDVRDQRAESKRSL